MIRAVRHESRLDSRQKDGSTLRAHSKQFARSRNPSIRAKALRALHGPAVPPQLAHLRELAFRLVGRSGASLDGALPLNPLVLQGYADMTRQPLEPYEVDVVLTLDSVIRNPDPDAKKADAAKESKR